jgi:hypothetical protein
MTSELQMATAVVQQTSMQLGEPDSLWTTDHAVAETQHPRVVPWMALRRMRGIEPRSLLLSLNCYASMHVNN